MSSKSRMPLASMTDTAWISVVSVRPEPPCTMYLSVKLQRAGSRMFKYSAEGYIERDGVLQPKRVFEANVIGVLL